MLRILTQLILSIKPRYLLYLHLVFSVIIAISEIAILFAIYSVVNKNFVNGDGGVGAVEVFSKFSIPNEYDNIFIVFIFLILLSSKITSLFLLRKISYLTEINISLAAIENYISPSKFEKLRKYGNQEFLAKNLTLPEDIINSLIVSTLQLVPILATLFIVFIGLIFAFGVNIFLYLTLLTIFAIVIYFITKRIISNTTFEYLNKRVTYLGALNQLWTVLPSVSVMQNSSSVMEYLEDVVFEKSSALAKLRVIKMVPKLFYDNIILLILIGYCVLAGTLGWDLVYFSYGIIIVLRLTPQISGIVNIFSQYQSGLTVMKRFSIDNEIIRLDYVPPHVKSFMQDSHIKPSKKTRGKTKIVSLESVAVKFRETVVFEKFTQSFYSSEIVAIIGSSGSGKTMLMETICGIKAPSTGKVLLAEPETKISYVPQFPQLFHLKTETLAKIWLNKSKLMPWSSSEKNKFEALLDRLGLLDEGINSETVIGDTAHTLSGGQMMRLTICLALLRDPDLLVMDEPTASLDAISAKKFLDLLEQVCFEDEVSVIISSHDPTLIQKATRVMNLK